MENHRFSSHVSLLNYDAEPPVFCEKCKAMFATYETAMTGPTWGIPMDAQCFETFDLLEKSATEGCIMCLFVSSRIPSEEKEILRRDQPQVLFTVQYTQSKRHSLKLCGYIGYPDSRIPHRRLIPSLYLEFALIPTGIITEKHFGDSTSSATALDTAIQWIKTCSLLHEKCHLANDYRPTRLVDVGSASKQEIRIVLGKDLPSGSRYLTLSHCWGSHVPRRLLRNDTKGMMKLILFHDLSKTFQDAIKFLRKLGERYIWIDSLCIVQDDEEDWQLESAQMGKIFAMSFCNLSATAAMDGTSGLFQSRNPSIQHLVKMQLNVNGTTTSFTLWNMRDWEEGVEQAPLNSRAWVCQERFMSPCNLHFGAKKLFWECKDLSACENFPTGYPEEFSPSISGKQKISNSLSWLPANHLPNPSIPHVAWHQLLREYTHCKLTFRRDKLVAISGLAAICSRLNNDQYVAGLWKSRLPQELLWKVRATPRNLPENKEYSAPSWSWAAIDERIWTDYWSLERPNNFDCHIEIVQINLELATPNPFGQVKGGSLSLKGPLARGNHSSEHFSLLKSDKNIGKFDNSSAPIDAGMLGYWDRLIDNTGGRDCFHSVYLLPIFGAAHIFEGLILMPTGNKASEFFRVGKFNAYDKVAIDIRKACEYFDTLPEASQMQREEDRKGGLKYSITLV